jgi:hypothetical protein
VKRHFVLRAAAAVLAVALGLAALWGLAWITFSGLMSAQAPDPSIPSGDPCCGHPDTWGEVASGVAFTLGLIVIDGLLIAAAVALYAWSRSGAWPRWRRLALIPANGLLAGVVLFAVVLVPKLDEGRSVPFCQSFVFREGEWLAGGDGRSEMVRGIAECGTFTSATRETVERRLGQPTSEGPRIRGRYISYDGLDLILRGDLVVGATSDEEE